MSRIGVKTTIVIEGLEELRSTLEDLAPKQVANILRASVHGIAGDARDRLKERVRQPTGQLRDSIKAYRKRSYPYFPVSEVRGGATAPYMLMLEFGTSRTKAQPFIVPTTEEMRPKLPAQYRETFGKKLEKSLERKVRKASKA